MTLPSMPDWTIIILSLSWLATWPLVAIEYLELRRHDHGL